MSTAVLAKLTSLGRPAPWKELGTTKGKLNPLESLGLVQFTKILTKTGKLPANPNAVKITTVGLAFLKATGDKSLSVHQEVVNIRNEVQEAKRTLGILINEVNTSFDKINSNLNKELKGINGLLQSELNSISKLESKLGKINFKVTSQPSTKSKVSFEIVRDAYYSNKRGLSDTSNLKSVITDIMRETGQSVQVIKDSIKRYYLKDRLKLHEGMGDKNYSINVDGSLYNLITVN